jgi:hypothetical protein
MRALVGFLALHAVLIATGFAFLRASGLVPIRCGWRAVIAALGPSLLAGAALVVLILIVLMVIGLPLTLVSAGLVCLACVGASEVIAKRRTDPDAPPTNLRRRTSWSSPTAWVAVVGLLVASVYAIVGAFVLGRLPTVLDDARIWSLRGLTLTYYHGLQPEIFQSQAQSGGHPIYPLFQPGLESLLFQAMGSPQLRFMHTELWLLFGAAIWTAGYLITRSAHRFIPGRSVWVGALALLALTPAAIHNIAMGYADITGSVMVAVGAVALAFWLDEDRLGYLALATVLLAAAANTKDEDLTAAILVLVVGGVTSLLRRRASQTGSIARSRLLPLAVAVLGFAALVLPWRIWIGAHHLTDGVEPPLPRALSPVYILNRTHELHEAATAMLTQTLTQWGWLAAVFIVTCTACFVTRTARSTALFYSSSFAAIVISLLWLYTTTPTSLAFLLATSMFRTVDAFMVLAAIAAAHLLARLADAPRNERHVTQSGSARVATPGRTVVRPR